MPSRTLKIAITVAVVLGGAGFLVFASGDHQYFKEVQDLVQEPDGWTDKKLAVRGIVEPGSIDERIENQKTTRTFILDCNPTTKGCEQGGPHRLMVRSSGPKPDTFRDLADVVAKGKLVKEGDEYVLHADELVAKCPSRYKDGERPSEYGQ